MDVRFVLVTAVALFGLCVRCTMSSTTSISNSRPYVDDLIEFIIENSEYSSNKTMDLFIKNIMNIINNNLTDIVIDNSTQFIVGNFTKFSINNSTQIIFDNSTSPKLTGPNICMFIKKWVIFKNPISSKLI